MKTKHTLKQLKESKGFEVDFGVEEVKYNFACSFNQGDKPLMSRIMTYENLISYGYHAESDSVMVEHKYYAGSNYFLIPLSEFERLGMIEEEVEYDNKPNSFTWELEANELNNLCEHLKSENRRLKEEVVETMNQLKLLENAMTSHPTESELDRKAWEYLLKSDLDYAICYLRAELFLEYRDQRNKGGSHE